MSERQTLLPGDHLPPIALPGADGALVERMHQSLAGGPRLLVLGRPPGAGALAAAEAALAPQGGTLVLVAATAPDGTRRTGGPMRLFDPERRVFSALGLPEGGVAVLTARGRLGFAGRAATPEEAVRAALATLPPLAAPELRRGGAPVLIVPDILDAPFVARLMRHWEAGEKLRDRVASGAGAAEAAGIKRRADVPLDDRALYAAFAERLQRRVLPEMFRAFRFRAASFELPRIGCYDAADRGAFGAHRDNRTPFTAHRRFAMSLNLNTGEYAGGTLRFGEFGAELYEPPLGGAAIFCCDLLHEALPVTEGRRFAIFTFFTDAEGAKAEAELIRQRVAAGQGGVALR